MLAAVLFDEPDADEALLHLAGRALHAPGLTLGEISDVARDKQRSGLHGAEARAALNGLAEQRIELPAPPVALRFDLASTLGLSTCDAACLWLAVELKAPLTPFDRRLAEAARAHLGALE